MMRHRTRGYGFSLIELMIAIVIFSFLVLLAAPMYSEFIGNSYIRNAAEAVLNGVRLAQTQAVKVNTQAAFVLDPLVGWTIHAPDPNDGSDQVIETYSFTNEGASRAQITPTTGTTTVTFDGLGRLLANADGTPQMTQIDVTNTNPNPRNLRVVITSTGGTSGIKLCDPAIASTDPAGCP